MGTGESNKVGEASVSDLRRIWMLSPPIFVFSRQHCSKRRNTIMARSCTVLVCKILFFFSLKKKPCLPKPNQSFRDQFKSSHHAPKQAGSEHEAASFNTWHVQLFCISAGWTPAKGTHGKGGTQHNWIKKYILKKLRNIIILLLLKSVSGNGTRRESKNSDCCRHDGHVRPHIFRAGNSHHEVTPIPAEVLNPDHVHHWRRPLTAPSWRTLQHQKS